uniref:Prefoldin subunit 5 n=1 Tax=Steinernema glaseri TaxID=37863 RepID=A0A1I8AKE5_9BILA
MASNSVKVDELSIEQLSQLNKQVDQELEFFNASINELRSVERKFANSEEAIKGLVASKKPETFVPLSESMYIKAKITDPKKYMIDIGTGYYVQMDDEKAREYFKRKQQFLQKQINQLAEILPQKKNTKAVLVSALQQKVALYSQQTGGISK